MNFYPSKRKASRSNFQRFLLQLCNTDILKSYVSVCFRSYIVYLIYFKARHAIIYYSVNSMIKLQIESITTIKTCISPHFIIILLSTSIHTLFTLFYFYLLFIFSHFIYHSSFHSLQLRFTIFGSRSIQILISYLHFYLYI